MSAAAPTINNSLRMYVRSLSWNTSNESLQSYFARFGSITDCTIVSDPHTGRSKGFGFVTFENEESLKNALASETHELDGRQVMVAGYRPKESYRTNEFQPRRSFNNYSSSNDRGGAYPSRNTYQGNSYSQEQRNQAPGEFRPRYPSRDNDQY